MGVLASVDIVIVNWNAGPQLRDCVESIFAHERELLGSVTVVDNASIDGSAEFCRQDERVRLIEPGRNLGFGTACNLGASYGSASYVLFLNPDTRFLRETLASVVSVMERREWASVGACSIRLVDDDDTAWRHCSRFPTPSTFLSISLGLTRLMPKAFPPLELVNMSHLEDAPVDHVMGAFYFIRRAVFEQIKGFDERFFVYYEDLDLSLRVHQAGFSIRYLAGPAIFHRTAGTTQGRARAKALSYLFEGRMLYADKHYNLAGRTLVKGSVLAIEPVRRIAHSLATGSLSSAADTLKAVGRLWAAILKRSPDRT